MVRQDQRTGKEKMNTKFPNRNSKEKKRKIQGKGQETDLVHFSTGVPKGKKQNETEAIFIVNKGQIFQNL